MKLRSIFRSPCLVPYALICAYGLFALTTPPQDLDASDYSAPSTAEVSLPVPTRTVEESSEPPVARLAKRSASAERDIR